MKKLQNHLIKNQEPFIRQLLRKFKAVLTGKKFQPLPSYWALVPVKSHNKLQDKINSNKGR
ncbi:MAG: hypothetical protein ABI741_07760 [Ferruginibacter sp.]